MLHANTYKYMLICIPANVSLEGIQIQALSQIQAYTCKYIHIRTDTVTYELPPNIHARINIIYTYIYIHIHTYIVSAFTYNLNMQRHQKKCLYLACIMHVYCTYSCIYVHMGVHICAYVLICAHIERLRDLAAKNRHTYEQYEHI